MGPDHFFRISQFFRRVSCDFDQTRLVLCQQFSHPGLPQHRDALPAQQLRRHAPALHHRSGEGAVIDLPGTAGGAALLQNGRLRPVSRARRTTSSAPRRKASVTSPPSLANTPPFRRSEGSRGVGSPPKISPHTGITSWRAAQLLHQRVELAPAVVAAGHSQQTRTDQQLHRSISLPLRAA